MPIPEPALVPCPACRAVLPIPAQQLGQKVRCGKCNEVFLAAVAEPVFEDNPFAIPPSHTAPDEVQEPAPRPRGKARTVEGKKGLGVPLIAGSIALGFVLVGGAIAGLVYAMKEPARTVEATKPKETPKLKEKDKGKATEPTVGPDGKMLDGVRETVKGSTVYIRTLFEDGKGATGTGFFAAGPGIVVTNSHVVGQTAEKIVPFKELQVIVNSGMPDSRVFPAKLLKADRGLDLALLKVDIPNLVPPPLEVIDSFKLKETQEIYIFGFPGGESIGTNISVNISTISSLRRVEKVPWIQVAGGMHPGNSGGPVTDAQGRVIGVARAGIRGTQINMAIPGDIVHAFFHSAGDLIPKK